MAGENEMEAVVLAAVVTLSLMIAVGAAWASLSLAMYLIDRTAAWTASAATAPAWAVEAPLPEHATQAREPLAA
jgi:hypothetical protein